MSGAPPWRAFIAENFPGYLLPASAANALSAEEAARFLERITGEPDQLGLLRAASTLSPRLAMLEEFALRALPELVRSLPSRTDIHQREWEGGFHGRLDLRGTLAHHLGGRRTRFVTRARHREFDLPENELVRAVAGRLLELLARLRQAEVVGAAGWGAGFSGCEGELRRLLTGTVLRDVPVAPVTAFHEQAADAARREVYRLALRWHHVLREGLDLEDPERIARVVAEGALTPLQDSTKFELAVVVRLVQTLAAVVGEGEPGRWTLCQTLVMPGRRELAELRRDDGASVAVYYNQAVLDPGPCDLGAKHYLGQTGRLRPDATIIVAPTTGTKRACVLETKLSADPGYILAGFHEAQLYRAEYRAQLAGWPQAILVASEAMVGSPRPSHDVVAVGWDRWVPEEIALSLLEGL
ncbi:MAG: hypothetical protein JOZ69_20035 [Myxococcales bacterium]|nr:hypothetical protein [Myxococcales bacterium]